MSRRTRWSLGLSLLPPPPRWAKRNGFWNTHLISFRLSWEEGGGAVWKKCARETLDAMFFTPSVELEVGPGDNILLKDFQRFMGWVRKNSLTDAMPAEQLPQQLRRPLHLSSFSLLSPPRSLAISSSRLSTLEALLNSGAGASPSRCGGSPRRHPPALGFASVSSCGAPPTRWARPNKGMASFSTSLQLYNHPSFHSSFLRGSFEGLKSKNRGLMKMHHYTLSQLCG